MWYYAAPKRQPGKTVETGSWADGLVQVQTIKSVEEFWAVNNTIKKPTTMDFGSVYSFFKTGVKPMWEDPANVAGGKWTVTLTNLQDLFRLDTVWEEVLMGCIGEYIDESASGDEITGAMLAKKRNQAKISLWTRSKDDEALMRKLGQRLMDVMALEKGGVLEFVHHGADGVVIKLQVE